MNKEEVLEYIKEKAAAAQVRDDLCARSTMYGLSCHFDFIPDEMVKATLNLAGGVGASSGSCGAFCSGQLAIGLKFNPSMDEVEREAGQRKGKIAQQKMVEFREAFLEEFGTTLCPKIHEDIFGRSFDFKDKRQAAKFFRIPDHAEKCASVVEKGAAMAAEIILESDDR